MWQVFEEEQPFLMAYRGPFDGFHAAEAAVSKTCLVRFDNNQYSVAARAIGRPVDVRAYAERIVIRQDGEIVAKHPRSFARGQVVYDPWHYVPILKRKPGALRNGAPFKGWQLRPGQERLNLAAFEADLRPAAIAKEVRVSRPTVQHVITAPQRDRRKTER